MLTPQEAGKFEYRPILPATVFPPADSATYSEETRRDSNCKFVTARKTTRYDRVAGRAAIDVCCISLDAGASAAFRPSSRNRFMSFVGALPKKRLYSRLNCAALM